MATTLDVGAPSPGSTGERGTREVGRGEGKQGRGARPLRQPTPIPAPSRTGSLCPLRLAPWHQRLPLLAAADRADPGDGAAGRARPRLHQLGRQPGIGDAAGRWRRAQHGPLLRQPRCLRPGPALPQGRRGGRGPAAGLERARHDAGVPRGPARRSLDAFSAAARLGADRIALASPDSPPIRSAAGRSRRRRRCPSTSSSSTRNAPTQTETSRSKVGAAST